MRLYGRNPVLERLKSNPKSIKLIYVEEGHPEGPYIRMKAKKWGLLVYSVPRSKMIKMGKSLNTQGLLLEVEDFVYTAYVDLLNAAVEKKHTLLFLDNLNDPQNLGSIIRSAGCLGGFSIVLPTRDSVGVTEAVLRVASGADNFVAISQISNLNQAIQSAKEAGFWIAGTVVEGGKNLAKTSLPFPLALVMGSEQKGIREIIRKQLDLTLTMPMAHQRLSLNVAQATTIFCYEIAKQKSQQRPQ